MVLEHNQRFIADFSYAIQQQHHFDTMLFLQLPHKIASIIPQKQQ